MKHFSKILLCFLLTSSLLLSLAACNVGNSRDNDNGEDEESIYGRYYFAYEDINGLILGTERMESTYKDTYIEIIEDGKGAIRYSKDDEEVELEWEDHWVWAVNDAYKKSEFKIEAGCLYLCEYKNSDHVIVFAMKGVEVEIPETEY